MSKVTLILEDEGITKVNKKGTIKVKWIISPKPNPKDIITPAQQTAFDIMDFLNKEKNK